jgi:glycosyltransferase involved in cell wall biosynthesis
LKAPFFTVLLPTRNRSEIVGGAVESVLGQTFTDFELVLSDNDESPTATRDAVVKYSSDPRFRYFRTSGKLPMHENWEFAFDQAQGGHVLILEDKMRLVPNTLEILRHYLQEHGDVPISYDIKFAKEPALPPAPLYPKAEFLDTAEVMELFCRFSQRFFNVLPKGLDSCAPRDLLLSIKKQSPTGMLFSYISPDYASAFMLLAGTKRFLHMDEPLVYVPNNWMWQGKFSNGQASYKKTDSYKRFLASLPVNREQIIANVPIKSEFLWINSVIYDFLTLYRRPDHQPQINWVNYHAFCIILILMGRRMGGTLAEESAMLKQSLRERGIGFTIVVLFDVAKRLAEIAWTRFRKLFAA